MGLTELLIYSKKNFFQTQPSKVYGLDRHELCILFFTFLPIRPPTVAKLILTYLTYIIYIIVHTRVHCFKNNSLAFL